MIVRWILQVLTKSVPQYCHKGRYLQQGGRVGDFSLRFDLLAFYERTGTDHPEAELFIPHGALYLQLFISHGALYLPSMKRCHK